MRTPESLNDSQPEEQRPFIEERDGKTFIDGKELKPFMETRGGKTFLDGKEIIPFMETKNGKTFLQGKKMVPFMEHREGKTFIQGKEVKPFSDIDAWANMNLDKNPEELADGFIKEEERVYKKLGHESDFYIWKTKDGGLLLRLMRPSDPNIECYSGKDPVSRKLLIEHYRKIKKQTKG